MLACITQMLACITPEYYQCNMLALITQMLTRITQMLARIYSPAISLSFQHHPICSSWGGLLQLQLLLGMAEQALQVPT